MNRNKTKPKKQYNDCVWIYVMAVICLITVFFGGGYFDYVSAYISIVLVIVMTVFLFRKKIMIPQTPSFLAFVILAVSYLVTALWAVDSGIAVGGFFKILPAVLFYVVIYQFENLRELLLKYVPLIGVLMTIFSCVMACFRSFASLVSLNGRLSGTFQYPNTFAIFLLVCLILLAKNGWNDKMDIVYAFVLLYGIFRSGSFTTYILTGVFCFVLLMMDKKRRRVLVPVYCVIVVAAAILLVAGNRFVDLQLKMSTFLGRILYAKDALPLIAKHPFGLGYYGYYFMESSVQTGVYTVVNVHNELLQFMLDVGILPGLFLYGVLVRAIVRKKDGEPAEYKIAMAALVLHSLFDFDFQFLSILFLVVLLLPESKKREWKNGAVIRCVGTFASVCLIGLATMYGTSNLLYTKGHYEASIRVGKYNTMAKIKQLSEMTDFDAAEQLAQNIKKANDQIPLVYDVLAQCEYKRGNLEAYIKQKLHAIKLEPYAYDRYLEYMNILLSSCDMYIQEGETESAQICLKRMASVYDMLDALKERTSALAYRIQDKPQFVLPMEYQKMMNQLEMRVNE